MKQSEIDFLCEVADMEIRYGEKIGLSTGRQFRKRTAMALKEKGLVESKVSVMVDGDGFAREPERHRWAYFLTGKGRAYLRSIGVTLRENLK